MSGESTYTVMFNVDGYDVEVTIKDMTFIDDPVPEDDELTTIGSVDYDFNILYEFEDQEAYEAVHRFVDKKIPAFINELISRALTDMINTESST